MKTIKKLLTIFLLYSILPNNLISQNTINQKVSTDSLHNTSQLENVLEVHPRQGVISNSENESPILAAYIDGPGVVIAGYSEETGFGGIIHYDELTKGFGGLKKMYEILDIISPDKNIKVKYYIQLYQGEYNLEILDKVRNKFEEVNKWQKKRLNLNIVKTDTTSCDGKKVILDLIEMKIITYNPQENFQNKTPKKRSKIEWIDKTLTEDKDKYSN